MCQYLTQPIGRGLGVELTAGAAGLLEVIESHYELDDPFTAHDLREKTGLGKVVYDHMRELRQQGYIKIKEPGAGNIATKYCRNPLSLPKIPSLFICKHLWHNQHSISIYSFVTR